MVARRQELAFRNNRRTLNEVFRKPLGGGDAVAWNGIPAERLEDWSRDGRYLLMGRTSSAGILAVPLTGDGKPLVVDASAANTDESQFSPDGRWISYFSAISGAQRDLPAALPGPGRACHRVLRRRSSGQVARGRQGALLSHARRDDDVGRVDVRPGARPDLGTPRPLFRTRLNAQTPRWINTS